MHAEISRRNLSIIWPKFVNLFRQWIFACTASIPSSHKECAAQDFLFLKNCAVACILKGIAVQKADCNQ